MDTEFSVSLDNIKAWIETGLRSFNTIPDNAVVTELSIGDTVLGKGLKDRKWQDQDVVPIRIKYKSDEEVDFIKFDG